MVSKETLIIVKILKRGFKMMVALLEKVERGEAID